jgi:SH3-like domain-containing protein
MKVSVGDRVFAEGYGEVEVVQVAEFDSIIQIRLSTGETAWTDKSLVSA